MKPISQNTIAVSLPMPSITRHHLLHLRLQWLKRDCRRRSASVNRSIRLGRTRQKSDEHRRRGSMGVACEIRQNFNSLTGYLCFVQISSNNFSLSTLVVRNLLLNASLDTYAPHILRSPTNAARPCNTLQLSNTTRQYWRGATTGRHGVKGEST